MTPGAEPGGWCNPRPERIRPRPISTGLHHPGRGRSRSRSRRWRRETLERKRRRLYTCPAAGGRGPELGRVAAGPGPRGSALATQDPAARPGKVPSGAERGRGRERAGGRVRPREGGGGIRGAEGGGDRGVGVWGGGGVCVRGPWGALGTP